MFGCQPFASLRPEESRSAVPVKQAIEKIRKEIGPACPSVDEKEIEKRLRRVLQIAINNHPNAEVRRNLNRLFNDGEIILAYSEIKNMVFFGVFSAADLPKTLNPGKKKSFYPTMIFDPYMLWCIGTDPEILGLLVILDHEYRHYQQWLQADAEGRKVFQMRYYTGKRPEKFTGIACKKIWQYEKEAYGESCRDVEPGTNTMGTCLDGEKADFEDKLLKRLITGTYQNFTECHEIWQEQYK